MSCIMWMNISRTSKCTLKLPWWVADALNYRGRCNFWQVASAADISSADISLVPCISKHTSFRLTSLIRLIKKPKSLRSVGTKNKVNINHCYLWPLHFKECHDDISSYALLHLRVNPSKTAQWSRQPSIAITVRDTLVGLCSTCLSLHTVLAADVLLLPVKFSMAAATILNLTTSSTVCQTWCITMSYVCI